MLAFLLWYHSLAGNFHGEYPAKALDYLAIGVSELASVSERRIERLVNPHLSALPAFLVCVSQALVAHVERAIGTHLQLE